MYYIGVAICVAICTIYDVDVAIFIFQLPVEKTDGMVVVEVSCITFTCKVYAMHCVVFLVFFLIASSAFNSVAQRKTS